MVMPSKWREWGAVSPVLVPGKWDIRSCKSLIVSDAAGCPTLAQALGGAGYTNAAPGHHFLKKQIIDQMLKQKCGALFDVLLFVGH
ncbi:hypothetical protein [Maricaulis sp.]|uniref:hypothetical protein n=1 Tax=Maricaulis sp. TaxID=1486257 RepID=UPI003A8EB95D